MHQTGITVDKELNDQFCAADAEGASFRWFQVKINEDYTKFIFEAQSSSFDDEKALFDDLQAKLEPKVPVYNCMRKGEKWLLASYIPDLARIKDKMVFASSASSLKAGFGTDKFISQDYQLCEPDEMTVAEYTRATSTDRDLVMSFEEKAKLQTAKESVHLMGTNQTAVIAGVPIKFANDTLDAVDNLKEAKCNTVELVLDGATEVLNIGPNTKDMTVDEIVAALPDNEPRYYLHNFSHTDPSGEACSKLVYIYYCPMKAVPKLKMFYSTCKAHIQKCLEVKGFGKSTNIEISETSELSTAIVMGELYPKAAVDNTFSKPKARAGATRGGRKKRGNFQM